jgi:hypothetical protein
VNFGWAKNDEGGDMKKLAIILVPLLILTLALSAIACGGGGEEPLKSTPKSTQTQALTSVYDSPAYGIRIAYPHDWTKEEGLGFVTFFAPKESDSDLGAENLDVAWDDLSAQTKTLNELTQLTISLLPQAFTDYQLIHSGETTLADRPAYEVVFTCKQGQYILKVRSVWAVENSKSYTITFAGEESKYTNYQEIVDQMIDSFEIY